ncbi:hypothetical protein [Actinoplanes sp. NPDC026670]|uniref:hypothetical protein n=1 Tax=Actinoplanes sp. NPDC026670 TaxID=3154700 RepID=UPI0033C1A599
MPEPEQSYLQEHIDRYRAAGDYRAAGTLAAVIEHVYRLKAASDSSYQPLLETAQAQLSEVIDEVEATGTEPPEDPEAYTEELLASINREHLTAGNPTGESDAAPDATTPRDWHPAVPRRADSLLDPSISDRYQDEIERRLDRNRTADVSVYLASTWAGRLATAPDRQLTARFALQAVLLARLGRRRSAIDAATAATESYLDHADQLDDTENGYYAYCVLMMAEHFLARRDAYNARGFAATAMTLFTEHRMKTLPNGIPDVVRAGLALATCAMKLKRVEIAVDTILDIAALANTLDRVYGGPTGGEPGAMPDGWGLPIVVSPSEWKHLRKQLANLARKLDVSIY